MSKLQDVFNFFLMTFKMIIESLILGVVTIPAMIPIVCFLLWVVVSYALWIVLFISLIPAYCFINRTWNLKGLEEILDYRFKFEFNFD